jgi:adenylosuccinate lyase
VQAGGDRQELHERIRIHSVDAAEAVKSHGKPNDLLQRLAGDAAFAKVDLARVMSPGSYVGRAPGQVDRFIQRVVEPIRRRYRSELGQRVELRV